MDDRMQETPQGAWIRYVDHRGALVRSSVVYWAMGLITGCGLGVWLGQIL